MRENIMTCLPTLIAVISGMWLLAGPAAAQPPRLANAQLITAEGDGDPRATVRILARETAAAWIGWAAPVVDANQRMCCSGFEASWQTTGGCCACTLDEAGRGTTMGDRERRVALEPGDSFYVLVRLQAGAITRIRIFSDDCDVDGGGRPVHWLQGVQPSASIAFLVNMGIPGQDGEPTLDRRSALSKQAIAAIAMHAGIEAEQALDRLLDSRHALETRKDVTFWLGNARGRRGYERLGRVLRDDPSEPVREAAVFGLYVSHVPEAVERIIETAKRDASTTVRGQALFWLAQKAGARATSAITDAIERDPETDVKKKAVFALSQFPNDEGVPLLIRVARTNRNPAVREQAMFWLGQSNDARAVAFFEEILR